MLKPNLLAVPQRSLSSGVRTEWNLLYKVNFNIIWFILRLTKGIDSTKELSLGQKTQIF